jgi:hypothetical protein
MVDGGVIASRFEEEAVSRRRIWDRSVDVSRGRVATVCVDILRIDRGAPEKTGLVVPKECYVLKSQDRGTCIDMRWRVVVVSRQETWWGPRSPIFPSQHPANLITTSLPSYRYFRFMLCLGHHRYSSRRQLRSSIGIIKFNILYS